MKEIEEQTQEIYKEASLILESIMLLDINGCLRCVREGRRKECIAGSVEDKVKYLEEKVSGVQDAVYGLSHMVYELEKLVSEESMKMAYRKNMASLIRG